MAIKEKINKVVNKYDVECVSAVYNIQGTLDIMLDQNIYYKAQARMVKELRNEIDNINDIDYRDIA